MVHTVRRARKKSLNPPLVILGSSHQGAALTSGRGDNPGENPVPSGLAAISIDLDEFRIVWFFIINICYVDH